MNTFKMRQVKKDSFRGQSFCSSVTFYPGSLTIYIYYVACFSFSSHNQIEHIFKPKSVGLAAEDLPNTQNADCQISKFKAG